MLAPRWEKSWHDLLSQSMRIHRMRQIPKHIGSLSDEGFDGMGRDGMEQRGALLLITYTSTLPT